MVDTQGDCDKEERDGYVDHPATARNLPGGQNRATPPTPTDHELGRFNHQLETASSRRERTTASVSELHRYALITPPPPVPGVPHRTISPAIHAGGLRVTHATRCWLTTRGARQRAGVWVGNPRYHPWCPRHTQQRAAYTPPSDAPGRVSGATAVSTSYSPSQSAITGLYGLVMVRPLCIYSPFHGIPTTVLPLSITRLSTMAVCPPYMVPQLPPNRSS